MCETIWRYWRKRDWSGNRGQWSPKYENACLSLEAIYKVLRRKGLCAQRMYTNGTDWLNEIGRWIKTTAEKTGMDVKKANISNQSMRSSGVAYLAKAGTGEQQLIKITGHSSTASIKSYLQMDKNHHQYIIEEMRKKTSTSVTSMSTEVTSRQPSTSFNVQKVENASSTSNISSLPITSHCETVTFHNCTFNFSSWFANFTYFVNASVTTSMNCPNKDLSIV